MDDDALPNHIFISLRHEFKAIRVMERLMSPTTIRIKCDISTVDLEGEDYSFQMEVARQRINHLVDEVLQNCLMISAQNSWAVDAFLGDQESLTTNSIMLCPEDPSDALLIELLLCKFKALARGAYEFHSIEIEASDGDGMAFTFIGGSPGETLPGDEEWLTSHNYFKRPWWHRDDASILDIAPEDHEDVSKPPLWAYSLGFISDGIARALDDVPNRVVRAEFRPRVIDGGRTDS